ncbi:uncharacterized protein Bfra_001981 [Botrytis fragariae]|uniref:Uncharacterized protein n=1 Tax=Botrytis fragariae TaxID=1964551 RepID=A0A8H6B1E8_9HELO|nr:uncharacterized protein Bfra_001981 [Botrytis fragariae]KAF5877614.1 hypothetical protein Bfra_001981 [Botrytis fragariae]
MYLKDFASGCCAWQFAGWLMFYDSRGRRVTSLQNDEHDGCKKNETETPRAPPMIAPTGELFDGYSVLTGTIPVLNVAAGSSVMVDDMIAGVEVGTLGFVANDEEDTVTVLSRVDMLTAARDEEDIVAGMGEVMVGTANQTAEPGAFAHVICV